MENENTKTNHIDGEERCRHCSEKLHYGYDKNELLHCQNCHRIWDGFAQCQCYPYSEDDDLPVKKKSKKISSK